ncbi:MAG: hypothetical protein ACTSP9_03125 [Promethearchaeota archaeon]
MVKINKFEEKLISELVNESIIELTQKEVKSELKSRIRLLEKWNVGLVRVYITMGKVSFTHKTTINRIQRGNNWKLEQLKTKLGAIQ